MKRQRFCQEELEVVPKGKVLTMKNKKGTQAGKWLVGRAKM